MRAVAIATHSPSHLDLGGGGFIRMMSRFRALGHDVQWLSYGQTADRLRALGWPIHGAPELKAARTIRPATDLPELEAACRRLFDVLADVGPDVLVIDRANTMCSAVAQELGVPYVAVGTPGGYWKRSVTRIPNRPRAFVKLSEELASRLGWRRADVYSAWLRSDELNITFFGRSFYGDSGERPGRTAYVNLFSRTDDGTAERRSLGIVLGNRGKLARMQVAVRSLIERGQISRDEPIDVLAGGRKDSPVLRGLLGLLASHQVTTHGWVDYGRLYSRMRRVISFGGTAAVWQALNHRLPMLLVDGGIGDQRFNCLAIERLGAGEVLHQHADDGDVVESYARLRADDRYLASIDTLRAADNYSDSVDSVVARIVHVAGH